MVSRVADSKCISRSVSPTSEAPEKLLAVTIGVWLGVALSGCGSEQQRPRQSGTADLVLAGGTILTMDEEQPRATALAVKGQRIVAVGTDDEVRGHIGPRTRVVELAGRGVTPGLVDSHAHLYGLGRSLEDVSLRGAPSAAEAAGRVAVAAGMRPAGEWVTGRGWDQNLWEPAEFPGREILDAVVPDHPVSLRRVDGHALWANSKALELAGVTAATKDPPGGRIVRDARGNPTGVLIDAAMSLVEGKVPPASPEVRERRLFAAAREALAAGIVCVHDMGIGDEIAALYRRLADQHRLPLRVYGFVAGNREVVESLPGRLVDTDRDGTAFFTVRGVKLFADGALGSRGAALLEPYADDPDNRGLWLLEPAELARAAEVAARSGWQLGIHAIGDAANRAVLDAYAGAIRAHPDADLRFRVEHAQVVSPRDLPRFGELGVIASMQPTHATSDMPWAEARVGPERIRGAYAWRTILASEGRIAAGSDFPVEEVPALHGIYAAVTRQDREGHPAGGWYPEQRLTLEEAIRAFTVEAAYASFVEEHRGKLRRGYVADITVYDRALAGDASLLDTQVDMTVVGGQIAYERD
jgi:predicted amidohydrolase YtcJ